MTGGHFTVPQRLVKKWGNVLDELEQTAEAYREDGWTTHELHPGHVAVLPPTSDRTGFDLLVPDNEFDVVVETESMPFDEFKIYRESEDGIEYCLVIAENHGERVAVFIPIYYEYPAVDHLVEEWRDVGYVRLHVHPLSKEKGILRYQLDDPELLFPHE